MFFDEITLSNRLLYITIRYHRFITRTIVPQGIGNLERDFSRKCSHLLLISLYPSISSAFSKDLYCFVQVFFGF